MDLTDKVEVDALVAWDWMRAARPLVLPDDDREEAVHQAVKFQMRALPMGARALPKLLTGFLAMTEERDEDLSALDWDAHDERRKEARSGEHRETP